MIRIRKLQGSLNASGIRKSSPLGGGTSEILPGAMAPSLEI